MFWVWFTFNSPLLNSYTFRRAVAAFCGFMRGPVNFVEDGVIYIATKSAFNRFQIGLVTIRSQLDAVRKT